MPPHTNVTELLRSGAALADSALERLLPSATIEPHSIHRAMRHSTFAGGKRLRPILCMEAARMVSARGSTGEATLPAGAADLGAAMEMVHTYSLIHDDLPALDNDDLRRGQPTCHVAFGDAIAILAGDALQTLAFQTIAQLPAPPATIVEILREFSFAIGTGVGDPGNPDLGGPSMAKASSSTWVGSHSLPPGMIGGQVVDIESEGHRPTAELVESIHRAKTGALITTSIVCGGVLGIGLDHVQVRDAAHLDSLVSAGRRHADIIARLRTFGEKAGLAFQIVDDILDVTQSSEQLGKTAGKDTAAIKATWPAVYGLERSRRDAAELIADADAALAPFGDAATPLISLAHYLVDRTH
jgi:geranylgeranyl diphosphate synthase type II